jgi:hypothetical protein
MTILLDSALMTFLMVAVSLSLISLLLQGLKALALAMEKRAAAGRDQGNVDQVLVAVLAAAAHTALQRHVRIRRIHVHHGTEDENWSRAGRVDIMHSHRVEPKR